MQTRMLSRKVVEWVLRACLMLLLLIVVGADGRAAPIQVPGLITPVTYDLQRDDAFGFRLVLRGGPIGIDEFCCSPRFQVGTNWRITLDFALDAFQGTVGEAVDERLLIFGEAVHAVSPPDAPMHQDAFPFTFSIIWSAAQGTGNRSLLDIRRHLPHTDVYRGLGVCNLCGVGVIGPWNVTLEGNHIPEPGTVLLVGLGALILTGYRCATHLRPSRTNRPR